MNIKALFLGIFLWTALALAGSPTPKDAIIGTWVLDAKLTKESAKFEISPLPEYQTDYFVYSDDGSILDVSVKKRSNQNFEDLCHFYMYLNNRISNEYCGTLGGKSVDKILSKRIDSHTYELRNGDPNSKEPWSGTVKVSADGKLLTVSLDLGANKPRYFRIFKRSESF